MIRYALACDCDHRFEAWFGSSADYDDQHARGLIECPLCGSHGVSKQIMAPAVAGTKDRGLSGPPEPAQAMMMDALRKVREHVESNFDYMGDRFADEARAIHEGRSDERGIYGEASPQQVRALIEDGVPVAPLPPKPKPAGALN